MISGIVLFVSFFGFHPEKSLRFSTQVVEESHHFFGQLGERISSFFIYFLGRSAYLFALILMWDGFVLLRNISKLKKTGLLFLSIAEVIFSMGLFTLRNSDVLYKGGGLFGKFIIQQIIPSMNSTLLFIIFLLCCFAGFFFLFKFPVERIYRLFTNRRTKRSIKRNKYSGYTAESRSKGYDKEELFEFDRIDRIENLKGSAGEAQKKRFIHIFPLNGQKNHTKKPPLIQRVCYDHEGMLLKLEPKIEKIYRKKEVAFIEQGRVKSSEDAKDPSPPGEQAKEKKVSASLLLRKSSPVNKKQREKETLRKAGELERTLREFGIEGKVTGIIRGPVITRYELQPAPGVKLSRIVNLSNNIALSLSANGVRIEAPIPGRSAVGIEIPNDEREIVTLGDIIEEGRRGGELPLILGKDLSGKIVVSDLTTMPHLLIAGATGSGKSVCVNSLIMSLLFQKSPGEVRFIMMDPKMVELKIYNGIPHLLTEVVTDSRDAAKALRWILYEMENRYNLLDQNYVRNITGYNQKVKEKMPYIVVIVDEFATLMAVSQKEVEDAVVRLSAMSRAVGIHLIMATQRPSVDVITGLIKANFPYRIAFQVAGRTDSRTILDAIGAEKLLGKGDMLFAPAGSMNIQRIQGAFISEEEVIKVVMEMKKGASPEYIDDIVSFDKESGFSVDFEDTMFDQAVEIVLKTKRASASFLQRRLKIGYNRAARLIELMEEKGIIGPPRGSKPREIYIDSID